MSERIILEKKEDGKWEILKEAAAPTETVVIADDKKSGEILKKLGFTHVKTFSENGKTKHEFSIAKKIEIEDIKKKFSGLTYVSPYFYIAFTV